MNDLLARIQDFTGIGRPGRRKWIFVSISTILFVLGQILSNVETLQGVRAFAKGVVGDLETINVINVVSTYATTINCKTTDNLGTVMTSCGWEQWVDPRNHFFAAIETAWDILSHASSPAAFLVYLIAVLTGFAVVFELWHRYVKRGRDTNPFDLAGLALGTILATSVVALVLQIAGIVLFFIFGEIVGLAILLLGDYRWVVDLFENARKVQKHLKRDTVETVDIGIDVADAVLGERIDPVKGAREIMENAETLERAADWAKRKFKGGTEP